MRTLFTNIAGSNPIRGNIWFLLLVVSLTSFVETKAQIGISPPDAAPIKLDCPQFPAYDFFDRNCLIKTAEPSGEIQLPQAGVDGLNLESPMWLTMPINKPGWALGIAHAWNWHRNMINKVNYPKMAYYMSILGQETGTACTCAAQFDPNAWPWTTHRVDNWDTKCAASNPHEGCFQMEEYNGWGQLTQIFPYRFDCGKFKDNIPGHRVATAALALSYRNVYNTMIWEYSWNTRLWEIVDNPNCDPYAYEKMLAVGWNSWVGGLYQNISGLTDPNVDFYNNRAAAANHGCWDLDATVGWYPEAVGWSMSVLYDNKNYCHYQYPWLSQQNNVPAGQQNHVNLPNYDHNYTWQEVSDYLDTICNFYFEYKASANPQKNADLKAKVKAVFDQLGGGGTVSFKQMGPVVDEIILCFPKENPLMNALHDDSTPNGYRGNWFSRCPGEYAPASHIEKRGYDSDTLCIGQSLVAAAVIDGGDGPNLSYTWQVNGANQNVNDSLFTFTATTVGEYMINLNVCSQETQGCADANCFMRLYVKDCQVCNITATSTSQNTPCQNMPDGTITLNVNGSTDYTVEYDGPYKGTVAGTSNQATITGLINGVYNITIRDNNDPNCTFVLSQEVFYDTPMNEKLVASINSVDSCTAELQANIESYNCKCDYTVYMREKDPYRWERYFFIRLTPSNGEYIDIRGNVFSNTNLTVEHKFQMCTGESIKVEGHILPASGSCDPNRTDAVNVQNSEYEVWVVDPNGVEVQRATIPIGAVLQYQDYFVFEVPVTCPFQANQYTYTWTPGNLTGQTVDVASSITQDITYTVIAQNQTNTKCSLKDTVTVSFNCDKPCTPPDTALITTNDSLIHCDTSSTLLSANQLQGYEYRWFKDNVEEARGLELYNFRASSEGWYKVLITDTANPNSPDCWKISDSVHVQYSEVNFDLNNDTTICLGDSITIFPTPTQGGWTYSWNTQTSNDSLSVTNAGEYILTITDSLGCSAQDSITITMDSLVIDLGSDVQVCAGPVNISVENTASQTWNTGSTANQISTDTSGTFWVIAQNTLGCSDTDSITVLVASELGINTPDTVIFCEGDSAKITVENADSAWTYTWSNNATTESLFVTTPGSYSVNVTDSLGCTGSDTTIAIMESITVDLGKDSFVCVGPVLLDAGRVYYSYLWNTGDTTRTILADSTRRFWVAVHDPFGCRDEDTIMVTISEPLLPQLSDSLNFCTGDTISVNAGDGYANYNWNSGFGNTNDSIRYFTTPGWHSLTVSNSLGCTEVDSVWLTERNNFVQLPNDTALCFGDSVQLTASGIHNSYLWTPVANTSASIYSHSNTGTVTYTVEVTDSFGCKAIDSTSITVQEVLTVSLGIQDTLSICPGTSANITTQTTGSTNVSFVWSDGSTDSSLTTNTEGWHSVTATNTIGCSATDSIYVKYNAQLSIELPDSAICEGEQITLSLGYDNSYTVTWTPGNINTTSLTIDSAGIYGVVVNDGNGCWGSDSMTLNVNPLPSFDLGNDTTICANDSFLLQVINGNNQIQWNNGATSASIHVFEGMYSAELTSPEGCKANDSILITQQALPVVNGLLQDKTTCPGNDITFNELSNLSLNHSYTWSNNSNSSVLLLDSITASSPVITGGGVVWVKVTDSIGCKASDTATVTLLPNLKVELELVNNGMMCFGDSAILVDSSYVGQEGYEFTWNTGSTTSLETVNANGLYWLEVNQNGCIGRDSIEIVFNTPPARNLDSLYSICSGEIVSLNYGTIPYYNYLWSTNETTPSITVSNQQNVWLQITDTITGCSTTDSTLVEVNSIPSVQLPEDTTICSNQNIVITPTLNEGSSQVWNTGSTENYINVMTGGKYVIATSDKGCTSKDSIYVSVSEQPNVSIYDQDTITKCKGDLLNFIPTNTQEGWEYEWSLEGANQSFLSISAESSTLITLTVKNGHCIQKDSLYLEVKTLQSELDHALAEELYCFEDRFAVELSAGTATNGIEYAWSTGANTANIFASKPGKYTVVISNDVCAVKDEIELKEFCPASLYFPNTFTPNGDGMNDTFEPKGKQLLSYHLLIFNRWGEQIFESYSLDNQWDGTYMSRDVQQDVYVWKVDYSFSGGEHPVHKSVVGHVAVVR